MGTFRKISCGYAEYKAIMLIVTSVIVAIIMWIFAIGMFISRSQKKGSSDTQKTPTGSTAPTGSPSMQEWAPPPIWVPILLLLLGPCFIVGSVFYYRFIKSHPYMCSAMGTAEAATDATRGIASLFRGKA